MELLYERVLVFGEFISLAGFAFVSIGLFGTVSVLVMVINDKCDFPTKGKKWLRNLFVLIGIGFMLMMIAAKFPVNAEQVEPESSESRSVEDWGL